MLWFYISFIDNLTLHNCEARCHIWCLSSSSRNIESKSTSIMTSRRDIVFVIEHGMIISSVYSGLQGDGKIEAFQASYRGNQDMIMLLWQEREREWSAVVFRDRAAGGSELMGSFSHCEGGNRPAPSSSPGQHIQTFMNTSRLHFTRMDLHPSKQEGNITSWNVNDDVEIIIITWSQYGDSGKTDKMW